VRHELLPLLERRFNPRVRETLARTASLLADEARLLKKRAQRARRRAGATEGETAVLHRDALVRMPRALARLVLRQALREAGGLRGVTALQVETMLDLVRAKGASGRSLPLPGGRLAEVVFGELRIAPKVAPSRPFALPLPVPGRVELPDGHAILAEPAEGPAVSKGDTAVVAAPGGRLFVRTRRPGDRVHYHGREVSLKRFLMARRIAARRRPGLPLVAQGSQVLFVPGQALDPRPGRKYVKLSLVEGPPA
jgi:tRNA(Ile)-lysidine synthase